MLPVPLPDVGLERVLELGFSLYTFSPSCFDLFSTSEQRSSLDFLCKSAIIDADLDTNIEGVIPDPYTSDTTNLMSRNMTYAHRVSTFTYTYGDNPIFRGRRYAFIGNRVVVVPEDRPSEVPSEDLQIVSETEEIFDTKRLRGPAVTDYSGDRYEEDDDDD